MFCGLFQYSDSANRQTGNPKIGSRKRDIMCVRIVILMLSLLLFSTIPSLAADPAMEIENDAAAPVISGSPLDLSFRFATYADTFVAGDGDSDVYWSNKFDAKLRLDGGAVGFWPGFFVNAHLEYVFGDDVNKAGDGSIWPVNTHTSLPRATGNNTTLSLTATQIFNPNLSVTVGKFNLVEAANNTPLVGGATGGGFNYVGFVAPPSFVAPPYALGAQIAVTTDRVNYSLLVYDSRSAQGNDFWDDPIKDLIYNGSATFKTTVGGLPGFYTLNYVHSTAKGLNFKSLLFEPGTAGFATNIRGYDYGAFKFQQYLYVDPANPSYGWGIFGQVAVGDGNPHPLGVQYMVGIGGNSPLPNRMDDRWGVAVSVFDWSSDLINGLAAIGTFIENETAVEVFYEAAINDHFRVGANLQFIDAGVVGIDNAWLFGTRARVLF